MTQVSFKQAVLVAALAGLSATLIAPQTAFASRGGHGGGGGHFGGGHFGGGGHLAGSPRPTGGDHRFSGRGPSSSGHRVVDRTPGNGRRVTDPNPRHPHGGGDHWGHGGHWGHWAHWGRWGHGGYGFYHWRGPRIIVGGPTVYHTPTYQPVGYTPPAAYSAPHPAAGPNCPAELGSFVSIVFVPTVTAADITGFLKAYNVTMADGPNNDGVYRIRLSTGTLPRNEVMQMIESMRAQTTVVSSVAGA